MFAKCHAEIQAKEGNLTSDIRDIAFLAILIILINNVLQAPEMSRRDVTRG